MFFKKNYFWVLSSLMKVLWWKYSPEKCTNTWILPVESGDLRTTLTPSPQLHPTGNHESQTKNYCLKYVLLRGRISWIQTKFCELKCTLFSHKEGRLTFRVCGWAARSLRSPWSSMTHFCVYIWEFSWGRYAMLLWIIKVGLGPQMVRNPSKEHLKKL